MKQEQVDRFLEVLSEYHSLGIAEQIDYQKFYLYSLITHSTAIEGSTVTEIENQLLFDEGITAKGRSLQEQMMKRMVQISVLSVLLMMKEIIKARVLRQQKLQWQMQK